MGTLPAPAPREGMPGRTLAMHSEQCERKANGPAAHVPSPSNRNALSNRHACEGRWGRPRVRRRHGPRCPRNLLSTCALNTALRGIILSYWYSNHYWYNNICGAILHIFTWMTHRQFHSHHTYTPVLNPVCRRPKRECYSSMVRAVRGRWTERAMPKSRARWAIELAPGSRAVHAAGRSGS